MHTHSSHTDAVVSGLVSVFFVDRSVGRSLESVKCCVRKGQGERPSLLGGGCLPHALAAPSPWLELRRV